jgi:hypothetical protein
MILNQNAGRAFKSRLIPTETTPLVPTDLLPRNRTNQLVPLLLLLLQVKYKARLLRDDLDTLASYTKASLSYGVVSMGAGG